MILWNYYVTAIEEGWLWEGKVFANIDDVGLAYEAGVLGIKSKIKVRINWSFVETSYGRLLFNEIVPEGLGFINETLRKWVIKKILARSFEELWQEVTAKFVDQIKNFWYKYSTISWLSISIDDMQIPENKKNYYLKLEKK